MSTPYWRMEFNITIRSAFPPYLVLRGRLGFKPAVLSENKKKEEIGEEGDRKKKEKGGKSKTYER